LLETPPFLLLAPCSSSSSESSLTSPYVHLPLLAHRLNLHDFSGDLPLGVYRGVDQDFALQVVRRRGRTLAYDVKGSREGSRAGEVLPG